MQKPYLIGVDIGTQGTKAALYSADGRQVAESFEASRLISPQPGVVEQDPQEMYGSVLRTVKQLTEQAPDAAKKVAAIGLDAQMAGIMGINRDFEPVTPYDSWLDTRCEPYIRQMKAGAEEEIVCKTGGQVTTSHGPKILWWKETHPEAYAKIAKFIVPTAFVAGKLCGIKAEQAYLDVTHLHFSGFADSQNDGWDDGLLKRFGVEKSKLPQIVRPDTVIGRLTAGAAAACGLTAGTPVCAGCGDSAASSLGAGITQPGMIYDVAGTASIFSCSTDRFLPDVRHKTLMCPRSAVDGLFIPLAYISGGGMCLHWFRELTGRPFAELDRLAESAAAGSEELLFIPHFAGRTCPNDSRVRGSFTGLSWNHSFAHMFRAIMESIAYEYRFYFSILQELDDQIRPTAAFGAGGGSRSAVFNQIKSDVLGVPYLPLKNGDTAPFGSAMLAGYAAGVFSDLKQAVKLDADESRRCRPNQNHGELYARQAAKYRRLLESAGRLYETGGECE